MRPGKNREAMKNEQKKEVTANAVTSFRSIPLNGRRGSGIAQDQGYHHADDDTDKGGSHPKAPAAGKFAGQVQPAHA